MEKFGIILIALIIFAVGLFFYKTSKYYANPDGFWAFIFGKYFSHSMIHYGRKVVKFIGGAIIFFSILILISGLIEIIGDSI